MLSAIPVFLCLIGKVDTLPEVLIDDLVGREGLWCYHVGVDELFRQGMAHPGHVDLVRGKAQDMSPGGELEEGIGRWCCKGEGERENKENRCEADNELSHGMIPLCL